MGDEKPKRIIRSGKLTPEEAVRDEEIRRNVQQEFPPARPAASSAVNSISETLKQAIKQSNRSVEQIGKEAGISQNMIEEFLSGQRDIPTTVADRLAGVLGLKLTGAWSGR